MASYLSHLRPAFRSAAPRWLRRWLPDPAAPRRQATRDVRMALATLLPQFETICVGVGDKIETLQNGSSELVTDCETLIHVASGRDGGENLSHETMAILKEPLAYVDFCRERQDALLATITRCEQRTLAMLAVRTRMETTLAPLTYLTTLFKIESARLDADLRDTFITVTTEIDRMRQLVNETFNQNAELLANAHSSLARVRQDLEKEFRTNTHQVSERRHQVGEAIATLDRQLAENGRRDIQLHTHSQSLAQEVAGIVLGLQFQDIVQQKCDHVLGAIATWDTTPPSGAAIRLQGLQLEGAASDLVTGQRTITQGIDRITKSIEQLDRSSQELDEFQGMVAASDGMVQRLLDSISQVHDMIRTTAELTTRTHAAVRPTADLAGNLTSTLVELSTNMRLIALNAQIRSVQIEQGTGLEQLAARTAEISREINVISEATAGDLSSLCQDIAEMLAAFEEFSSRGSAQLTALSRDRVAAEANLHALRDRAIATVVHIGVTTKTLQESTASLRASIAPLDELSRGLTSAGATLAALVDPAEIDTRTPGELAAEASRYTMASELATHQRLHGQNLSPPAVATPSAELELFDTPAPTAFAESPSAERAPVPTAPATTAPAPAGVDFF